MSPQEQASQSALKTGPKVSQNPSIQDSKLTVLVIGDSVSGHLATDYPSLMASDLEGALGTSVQIINHSTAAQRTSDVLEYLDRSLRLYRPTAAVVMIGKSDYYFDTRPALSSIRLVALLEIYWHKFMKKMRRYDQRLQLRLHSFGLINYQQLSWDALNQLFWKTRRDGTVCRKYGEELSNRYMIKNQNVYERGLKALYECYVQTRELVAGIRYFSDLETQNPIVPELLSYMLSLSGDREGAQKLIDQMAPDQKSAIKARLIPLTKTNQTGTQRYFSLLAQTSLFPQKDPTKQNLRKIAKKLKTEGTLAVFAQYPTDSVERLKSALGDDEIRFFNTHQIFAELSKVQPIQNYFQDDWEHLTPEGHRELSQNLSNFLAKLLKQRAL